MNVGESNALNQLLHWILGEPALDGTVLTEEEAMECAALLAEASYKKLWAGYCGDKVRELWRKRRLA